MEVDDVEPRPLQFIDTSPSNLAGFVGRIVEDLNLESIARPFNLGHGVDQTTDDRRLVVDGKLNGHLRQSVRRHLDRTNFRHSALEDFDFSAEMSCHDHEIRPVDSVNGQDEQNGGVEHAQRDAHGGAGNHTCGVHMSKTCISSHSNVKERRLHARSGVGSKIESVLRGHPAVVQAWR